MDVDGLVRSAIRGLPHLREELAAFGIVVAIAAVFVIREAGRIAQDPPAAIVDPDDAYEWVVEHLPDDLRKYYEDATRVLEAVGAHASHVDEKTARRALQFTTQVLRNLFEIPPDLAARSEPEDEPE